MSYKTYENYKNSGIDYIGTIPEYWEIVRNKNLFHKSKIIVGENWKKYNVLSLTKNGVIIRDIESNEGKMPSDFSIYQIVNSGNLLMCLFDIDVTPRCVGYIENKGIVSAAYTELNAIDKIFMKFYYYWYLMLDIDKQLLHLSKNLRNSLSTDDFMALYVIKPSLKEQKSMSIFLDKKIEWIEENIVKNKELISLLEEKKDALINQVVTKGLDSNVPMKYSGIDWIGNIPENWTIERLGGHSDIITGYPFNADLFSTEGIPLIRIRDLKGEDTTIFWNDKFPNYSIVKNGDLLVGMDGDFDVVSWKGDTALLNQRIFKINGKNKLLNNFLKYILQISVNHINELTMSTTVKHLSIKDVNNIRVPIPSYEEQEQIVNFLIEETSKIDKTIEKIEKQIGFLEEYKTSLIYHVVTGKIDVRDEV